MPPFLRLATFTVVRDSAFVALAAATFMVGFSFYLPLAFDIGAGAALLFSLAMMIRAARLTPERITQIEAWRMLPKDERPAGEPGRQWAKDNFTDLLLRFAKAAALVAVLFAAAALLLENAAPRPLIAAPAAETVVPGLN